MENIRQGFNFIISISFSILTFAFGDWDTPIIILISFIAIDYITGILTATLNKTINSNIGFNGLLRKSIILIVLIIAVLLDRLLNQNTWVFRTLICYFYIANEGISILENLSKAGVPFPQKIKNALEQLKKEND